MSCPNSSAPKCCAPPKKPCPPAPPVCNNLPATKTFTCPAETCPKEEKTCAPCPPKEEKCVALGKAEPETCGGGGKASSGSAPAAPSGANCGGNNNNNDNSCEVKPLSMVRGPVIPIADANDKEIEPQKRQRSMRSLRKAVL